MSAVAGDSKRIRVAVVGTGEFGRNHARVYRELEGVELVGVYDKSAERAGAVAQEFQTTSFHSLEELRGRVDAASVAVPTVSHAAVGCRLMEMGLDVLVEKPMAVDLTEADTLLHAAKKNGRILQVGHVERFNPAVQAIKNALRAEDILSIAITRVGPFPPRMSNVGVVIDLAVHDIDLIRWFTDSEIVEVQPQLSSAIAEREDIALLQFRTASGVLAHINTNWITPFKARNVTVATRNKYIMGDLLTRQVTECFGFQPDGSYSMRHLSVGHSEPLRAELQAFASAILSGKQPAVTGEEGVAGLEIAIQCLQKKATPSATSAWQMPRLVTG